MEFLIFLNISYLKILIIQCDRIFIRPYIEVDLILMNLTMNKLLILLGRCKYANIDRALRRFKKDR